MKSIFTAAFLLLLIVLPVSAYAEEQTNYLLYSSDSDVEMIKKVFPEFTRAFDLLPMVEVSLSDKELNEIKNNYSNVQVFPVNDYEVSELQETIPPQFALINSLPENTSPYTGKGVKVALLDSGIDVSHNDLEVAGGICTLPVEDCAVGTPYSDDLGHGTHVAGIIAAKNNGIGTIGIAPDVELYSIKIIDKKNSGKTTDIIAGIEWAIKNNIEILNMSITTDKDDPALKLMIEKAYQSGMILVASAGNEEFGDLIDSVQFPAKYANVIAVSAITQNKTRVFQSSIGPEVELAAPGNKIRSTYPVLLDNDGIRDGYKELSGTSMAAPHVVGVIALLKERLPEISNTKMRAILANTAEDLGVKGRDKEFGYGLVRYPTSIEEIPIASHYSERSKIVVELSNADRTTNRKLQAGDVEIKEREPGVWELYRFKGDHKLTLSYQGVNGKVMTEQVNVHVETAQYKDLNPNKWYIGQIAYLAYNEGIHGYLDNTFRPDARITRAEAVVLLGRMLGHNGEKRKSVFTDVNPNSFASGYIQSAVEADLVAGFTDGTFRPDEAVTRAEMTLLLQQAFQFPIDKSRPSQFTDMTPNVTSYEAVRALAQAGIIEGYPDGTFRPQEPMTRAIFSVFLAGAKRPDLFK